MCLCEYVCVLEGEHMWVGVNELEFMCAIQEKECVCVCAHLHICT